MEHNTIQHKTTQCNLLQYNTIDIILYNTTQCNTTQYNTVCKSIQCHATSNTVQYNTTQNTTQHLQHMIQCNTIKIITQDDIEQCNTIQDNSKQSIY